MDYLSLDIQRSAHRRLVVRSARSAARFNRDKPASQNEASSACSRAMAD
jgi:hypothetical protein